MIRGGGGLRPLDFPLPSSEASFRGPVGDPVLILRDSSCGKAGAKHLAPTERQNVGSPWVAVPSPTRGKLAAANSASTEVDAGVHSGGTKRGSTTSRKANSAGIRRGFRRGGGFRDWMGYRGFYLIHLGGARISGSRQQKAAAGKPCVWVAGGWPHP